MIEEKHGGTLVAEVLVAQGVRFIFTLCGGHISPILVASKQAGIQVIDTRQEATAVFAADAVARLSGVPGVAAVTAGPGVTNTITAIKNAQLAQSPLVLIGGATATALKNRGALQDIDQKALFKPHVKWLAGIKTGRQIVPLLETAFRHAREGIPGPVFVELPVDLLYPEEVVRKWYLGSGDKPSGGRNLVGRIQRAYLNRHLNRLFRGPIPEVAPSTAGVDIPTPRKAGIQRAARLLGAARKPLMIVGSQAMFLQEQVSQLAAAIQSLGMPVYLAGMARGLLGVEHPLLCRHQRRKALREADLVILAGMPCDFRLNYGRQIPRSAQLISINRDPRALKLNRRPTLAVRGDPALFIQDLAAALESNHAKWSDWLAALNQMQTEREQEIQALRKEAVEGVNPLRLLHDVDGLLAAESVIVADGGDFVASAAYTVRPRSPLSWLDPGVFGTLGVGAGFALGAKLLRPDADVWILYGDGSVGYSLIEMDTFTRQGLPVIAVVGNDGGWSQIAREQVEILGDDTGTALAQANYHQAAEGLGAKGFLLDDPDAEPTVLQEAVAVSREGTPVLINALIGKTEFRKGAISI
ncbi:MAG: thiamine pyrophosphate-binding protein [Fidelibacterota bacterium]|nr:MAG: thiamine pyrophosphate-binding protein [Candidatus Neomarinimicrobiota bacterium]